MDDNINPGITGETFGVKIDTAKGIVTICGEVLTDDPEKTALFLKGYFLGREHKKMEINKVLRV
jgi:hypothetical protein